MKRKGKYRRKTNETDIDLELTLEDAMSSEIDSGVPFFNHMLSSMARLGRMRIKLTCQGDYEIDDHHTVEDTGIALGNALKETLGDKEGINRFADATVPMEDSLVTVSIDLSGRPYFQYEGPELSGYIGRYSEELTSEFLRSFSSSGAFNLHVRVIETINRHHAHEAIFKALGLCLYNAAAIDPILNGRHLSTKGSIE
jgi:imidazoleglycerol-phosphate dehydratase